MDLALLVYAISLTDKIGGFLTITAILLSMVTVAYCICYQCEKDDSKWSKEGKVTWPVLSKTLSRKIKFYIAAIAITASIITLIPSEKTAYTMVAAYAAQTIAKDPKVQQLSAKVLKIVEDKLDSYSKVPVKTP